MTNKKVYIYALSEKDSTDYRYVGKTICPEKRLKNHIKFSKLNKTRKDAWIQSLSNKNKVIEIKILEETDNSSWPNREKFWIDKLKNEGYNLTNHNNGGLGGGHIKYTKPFDFVKKWVQTNYNIKSVKEWCKFTKENEMPNFIPLNPKEVYENKGWKSWGDFLGTNRIWDNNVNYISYEEAKKYINTNFKEIKTSKNWKEYAKENKVPQFIPNRPERYYKNRNWKSWGDFLGTNKIANQNKIFLNYKEAKNWINKNHQYVNRVQKWYDFVKCDQFPNFIPKCPQIKYKNCGWVSWKNFLR